MSDNIVYLGEYRDRLEFNQELETIEAENAQLRQFSEMSPKQRQALLRVVDNEAINSLQNLIVNAGVLYEILYSASQKI